MKRCPNCGRETGDRSAYCPACGAALPPADDTQQQLERLLEEVQTGLARMNRNPDAAAENAPDSASEDAPETAQPAALPAPGADEGAAHPADEVDAAHKPEQAANGPAGVNAALPPLPRPQKPAPALNRKGHSPTPRPATPRPPQRKAPFPPGAISVCCCSCGCRPLGLCSAWCGALAAMFRPSGAIWPGPASCTTACSCFWRGFWWPLA